MGSDCGSQRNSCFLLPPRACSTLSTSEVKNGFEMLGTTMPTVSVRLFRSARAMGLIE